MAKDTKGVALILDKMDKAPVGAPEDAAEGEDMGLTTAMQELIDAVKSGDAGAASAAFKSAVSLCGSGYEE
jgi:hypothetical protein